MENPRMFIPPDNAHFVAGALPLLVIDGIPQTAAFPMLTARDG
jgi:hypothetical protein